MIIIRSKNKKQNNTFVDFKIASIPILLPYKLYDVPIQNDFAEKLP